MEKIIIALSVGGFDLDFIFISSNWVRPYIVYSVSNAF